MVMNKLRYNLSLLERVEPLVKAGMMAKPVWYKTVKLNPPFVFRPSNKLKKLSLPWDHLARDFVERNPDKIDDPLWLGQHGLEPGTPPLSHVFAKRQYALIQKGLSREAAYKRVEKALHKERMEDVDIARRLVLQASSISDSRPSFVSDEGVYDGLRQWQAIMRETPYAEWDAKAKIGLNTWLRREVLKYDDVRLDYAKNSHDGTAEAIMAETDRLRVNLFPETKGDLYVCPTEVADLVSEVAPKVDAQEESAQAEQPDKFSIRALQGDALLDAIQGKNAHVGDEYWTYMMRKFRKRAAEFRFEDDWDLETRSRLDAFMIGRCVRRSVLEEAFGWLPKPPPPPPPEEQQEDPWKPEAPWASSLTVEGASQSSGWTTQPSEETGAVVPSWSSEGEVEQDFGQEAWEAYDEMNEDDDEVTDPEVLKELDVWADKARASSEKLDKLEDMTSDKKISAYLEDLVQQAQSEANRDPFAGYTDEDDGSERWIVAAKLPDNTYEFVDWFNAARFRTRTSREDGTRPGVYQNVKEVLSAAKRQLLPNLVLAVDEPGLDDEEKADLKRAMKAQTEADAADTEEMIRKNRDALFSKLESEWGARDPLERQLLDIQRQQCSSAKDKHKLRKEEKRLIAQIEEQKAAKAAAGIADGKGEFVVPESMGVEMDPLVLDGSSHTNFPAKRSKLKLFDTPEARVPPKSVTPEHRPTRLRTKQRWHRVMRPPHSATINDSPK